MYRYQRRFFGRGWFLLLLLYRRGCPADGVAAYFDVFFVVVMDGPSKDNRIGDSHSIFFAGSFTSLAIDIVAAFF